MLCAYTYYSMILRFVNIRTHSELGLFLVSFECGFLTGLINDSFIFCTRMFYLKRGAFIHLLLCLECGVFTRIHHFLSFNFCYFLSVSDTNVPPPVGKKIMNRVKK